MLSKKVIEERLIFCIRNGFIQKWLELLSDCGIDDYEKKQIQLQEMIKRFKLIPDCKHIWENYIWNIIGYSVYKKVLPFYVKHTISQIKKRKMWEGIDDFGEQPLFAKVVRYNDNNIFYFPEDTKIDNKGMVELDCISSFSEEDYLLYLPKGKCSALDLTEFYAPESVPKLDKMEVFFRIKNKENITNSIEYTLGNICPNKGECISPYLNDDELEVVVGKKAIFKYLNFSSILDNLEQQQQLEVKDIINDFIYINEDFSNIKEVLEYLESENLIEKEAIKKYNEAIEEYKASIKTNCKDFVKHKTKIMNRKILDIIFSLEPFSEKIRISRCSGNKECQRRINFNSKYSPSMIIKTLPDSAVKCGTVIYFDNYEKAYKKIKEKTEEVEKKINKTSKLSSDEKELMNNFRNGYVKGSFFAKFCRSDKDKKQMEWKFRSDVDIDIDNFFVVAILRLQSPFYENIFSLPPVVNRDRGMDLLKGKVKFIPITEELKLTDIKASSAKTFSDTESDYLIPIMKDTSFAELKEHYPIVNTIQVFYTGRKRETTARNKKLCKLLEEVCDGEVSSKNIRKNIKKIDEGIEKINEAIEEENMKIKESLAAHELIKMYQRWKSK